MLFEALAPECLKEQFCDFLEWPPAARSEEAYHEESHNHQSQAKLIDIDPLEL
jgi:hypothetical protein